MKKSIQKIISRLGEILGRKFNGIKKERRKPVLLLVFVIGVIILSIQTVLAFWRLKNNF